MTDQQDIWVAASDGELAVVKSLVKEDPSLVNAMDEAGYTPLHAAASWKHPEVVKFLVESGADVNIADPDNDTPLHVCEDVACAEILLKHGANGLAKNKTGKTPIDATLELDAPDVARYIAEYVSVPLPEPRSNEIDQDLSDIANGLVSAADLEHIVSEVMKEMRLEDANDGEDPSEDKLRELVMREIISSLKATLKDSESDDAKKEGEDQKSLKEGQSLESKVEATPKAENRK